MGTIGSQAEYSVLSDDPALSQGVLDAVSCLVVVGELATGHVVHANTAVQAMSGLTEAELLGRRWEDLLDKADQETMCAAVAGPGGPALGFETTLPTANGERRRVLWSIAFAGERADGRPSHVVLSGIDVTPEVRASGLFSQLMRTAATPALVGTDLMGRVTLYNSAAERMLGYPASAMLGRVIRPDLFDRAEFEERAQRLGVPADLSLLAADLTKLDRRRSNLDLGSLDRRRRADDQGADERRGGSADDRRGGSADDRRGGSADDRRGGSADDRRGGSADDRPGGSADDRRGGSADDRRGGSADDRRGGSAADRRGGSAADRRGPAPLARDWTLVRNGGDRFTASLAVVKVTDALGEVVGYLGVADDVTEQRRSRSLLVAGLEKEVEAVRRLQELDRAKDDFVATVSHELRTPITSILGYVELLLDTVSTFDSEQVEMLEAVQRNGDRLRTLADNLLTLSSFASGEFVLMATEVDLRETVCRAEEALRPLVDHRRLDLSYEVPAHPVVILGDGAHLERVLFNLLSNALKFTEDGGSIVCSLRPDGQHAVIEVSDTGIGIPEAEQSQLFTRFFRSSIAQQRAIQGTGMGLAVVDSIVRRHGGEVSVESEERRGTTVTIRLPLGTGSVVGPE